MPSPSWWKEFYSTERTDLGTQALEQLFETAPLFSISEHEAIIFPHTRLRSSGELTAAAARAVLESGCEAVLALGMLHLGERRNDVSLRGIHGPNALNDKGIWRDEFSLDNFEALLSLAADIFGKPRPRSIIRYPFLTGSDPESLTGFKELSEIVARGAAVVATADMVHHGAGYGTPSASQLAIHSTEAIEYSRLAIREQFSALATRDYQEFLEVCGRAHSDFRDVGPVLAALLPIATRSTILDLKLVPYADVLDVAEPTWVAAALATFGN